MRAYVLTYHSGNVAGNDYATNNLVALGARSRAAPRSLAFLSCRCATSSRRSSRARRRAAARASRGADARRRARFRLRRSRASIPRAAAFRADGARAARARARRALHATSFVIASPDARRQIADARDAGLTWIGEHWWAAAVASGRFDIGNHGWDHVSPSVTTAGGARRQGGLVPPRRHLRGGRPAGARRARIHRGPGAQSGRRVLRVPVRRRERLRGGRLPAAPRRAPRHDGRVHRTARSDPRAERPVAAAALHVRHGLAIDRRARADRPRLGRDGRIPPMPAMLRSTTSRSRRRAARHPWPRRRHRAPRARADRRVAGPLPAPSRDRGRRALAGRGALSGRYRAQLRIRARRGRDVARVRRRALRIVPDRRRPPAQHHRMPRRHHRSAVDARTFPTDTRFTTSTSRARRSCSSASTACTAARRPTPSFCGRCLAAQPPFAAVDIVAWRAPASRAPCSRGVPDRAVALDRRDAGEVLPRPRRSTSSRTARRARGRWRPVTRARRRSDDRAAASRARCRFPDDDVPTVAVLGAVGPDKGARRLERLADLVRATGARVRFVLIGYMDVQHGPWQSDDAVLTVHGRYDPRELPELFAHYRVRLVAYPSAGPETFSFTLSEAWAAGLPGHRPPVRRAGRARRREPARAGCGPMRSGATRRGCSRASSRLVAPEHAARACRGRRMRAAASRSPRSPRWPSARSLTTMRRSRAPRAARARLEPLRMDARTRRPERAARVAAESPR